MKNMRRIITLALAAILILGLVIPAFAEDTVQTGGKLVITGAVKEDPNDYTVYTVYKMFNVQDGNNENENLYTVSDGWEEFVTVDAAAYFTLVGGYVNFEKATTTTADAAVIAELAKLYVNADGRDIDPVTTVTVNAATPTTLADNGYYLLVPNNNTVCGVIVVKNGDTEEITEKTIAPGVPQLTKEVYEDSLQKYGKLNTVQIGEASTYKVTIIAGQGASNYVLHDAMDDHIQFDASSVKITRGGNVVSADEYTVVPYEQIDHVKCPDCTFHIVFGSEWCKGLNENATIVVTYNGTLLAQAEEGGQMVDVETAINHENTAWLSYTDQPGVETEPDTVATQTYEINVLKVDQNNQPLAGAGFVLKDNEGMYYDIVDHKVVWTPVLADAVVKESDENGKLAFYGVDAEIFQLVEVQIPGGYTGVGDTQVSTKGEVGQIAGKNVTEADPIVVKNILGNALPETGGIGTTVFYILGAALVIIALGALVIVKRKETSAQ